MAASPTAVSSPNIDGGNILATLLAAAAASMHRQQQQQTHANDNSKSNTETHDDEIRSLEPWHDEDEKPVDDTCFQELVDPSNPKGWSADEMFKYNEKMHKITSNYNETTISENYTTHLPRASSRTTMRLATRLAKEIEDRVIAEGRVTPESSDDDELFESERTQRVQLKQQRELEKLLNPQRSLQHRPSNNHRMNGAYATRITTESSSQYSNSTETPATASLSSSPTLNDNVVKSVTSSCRNILRTCLT